MRCIVCGCTEDAACLGGCYWHTVEPPVCSACVEDEPIEAIMEPRGSFFSDEVCPASPTPAVHVPLYLDETSGYCARCRCGFAA